MTRWKSKSSMPPELPRPRQNSDPVFSLQPGCRVALLFTRQPRLQHQQRPMNTFSTTTHRFCLSRFLPTPTSHYHTHGTNPEPSTTKRGWRGNQTSHLDPEQADPSGGPSLTPGSRAPLCVCLLFKLSFLLVPGSCCFQAHSPSTRRSTNPWFSSPGSSRHMAAHGFLHIDSTRYVQRSAPMESLTMNTHTVGECTKARRV